MPNAIKYNASTETLSLKKGNFWIGTGDVDKGPTSTTGFYYGITPPSAGYTIYLNKATNGPSIIVVENDATLILVTNRIASASYTTVAQCLEYFIGQSDKMIIKRDYENIITNGLIINLDAGFVSSYPRTNSTWYDISSSANNGTMTNGPTFSSDSGGVIVFDGSNDFVSVNVNSWIRTNSSSYTFSCFFKLSASDGAGPFSLMTYPNDSNNNDGFWQHLNLGNWLWRTEDNSAGELGGNVEAPSTFVTNVWYNVTVVVKTNTLIFYRNGSLINTISTTFSWANLRNDHTAYLYIGSGYGENYFLNGQISNFQMYNRELSAAEVLINYNALKDRYLDGSTAEKAAPSASHLVSLGYTTNGTYYIDLPTVGPTLIYCILDPAYDGGGWMMMMKATRGTTFNYSSNYWTTTNTLNTGETNRNDGDAKFNTMNYFQAKDMMAVFPDISNGGSITSSSIGWTWLQNDFNDGSRTTPVSFFNISYPTMNVGGSGKFIKDAKTFSGWASGVFSSQVDIRFYGFNYTNNPYYFGGSVARVRWGFAWNENGEGLYPGADNPYRGSNDVSGGIGMDTSFGSFSAGDQINCCQDTTGINRSARVEVYIR